MVGNFKILAKAVFVFHYHMFFIKIRVLKVNDTIPLTISFI